MNCPLNPSLGVTLDPIKNKNNENGEQSRTSYYSGKREKRKEENLNSTWREGQVTRQEGMDDLPHL